MSTEVMAAGCPEFVVDEYARVLMARNTEDNPTERLEALSIYKTDETGMIIADLVHRLFCRTTVKEKAVVQQHCISPFSHKLKQASGRTPALLCSFLNRLLFAISRIFGLTFNS